MIEWPLIRPDLNLVWRGSKRKVRRYPRLITNEKDV